MSKVMWKSSREIHIWTLLYILKFDENNQEEYNCNIEPRNQVLEYKIDHDFKAMYGDALRF
jgi:hypothetical protein